MAHTRLLRVRSVVLWIGLLVGLILVPSTASASGGGGCGRRVTDAAGTTVTIRQYCFGPTILRVAPGETVTWVNKDRAPHTVLGANAIWGDYSTLRRADRATYRFARPGVYPYVCTYHPGMVGAVVVGDEAGLGSAGTTTTAAGPVTTDPTEPETVALGVARPVPNHTGFGQWAAGVAGALVLSSIAALAWVWSRRHRAASVTP